MQAIDIVIKDTKYLGRIVAFVQGADYLLAVVVLKNGDVLQYYLDEIRALPFSENGRIIVEDWVGGANAEVTHPGEVPLPP